MGSGAQNLRKGEWKEKGKERTFGRRKRRKFLLRFMRDPGGRMITQNLFAKAAERGRMRRREKKFAKKGGKRKRNKWARKGGDGHTKKNARQNFCKYNLLLRSFCCSYRGNIRKYTVRFFVFRNGMGRKCRFSRRR